MARLLSVVAILLLLALAGCFSGNGDPAAPASSSSSSSPLVPDDPVAEKPTTTDTLYLAAAPRMTKEFPNTLRLESTPFGGNAVAEPIEWEYKLTSQGGLMAGNATIWFNIPAGSVRVMNPAFPACPFSAFVGIGSPDGNNAYLFGMECDPQPEVVAVGGDVEVAFAFTRPAAEALPYVVDDLLLFWVSTSWTPPPGEVVSVQHGAPPFASRVTVEGLVESLEETVDSLLVTH